MNTKPNISVDQDVDGMITIVIQPNDSLKTDSPDSRPMNSEEIVDWLKRIDLTDYIDFDQLKRHIDQLVSYETLKAKIK